MRRRHRTTTALLSCGGLGLFFLALSAPAWAQYIVRTVNLTELTRRAAIIVEGRVVEARYEGHPDYRHVRTVHVTLQVARTIRGEAEEEFSFRQFLPGLEQQDAGKPLYAPGQHVILFLPRPSRYGLSSPLGGGQGHFLVRADRSGREMVVNPLNNMGLFQGVESEAEAAGVSLSPAEAELALTERGPVAKDRFLALVGRLANPQGTE